MRLSNDDPSWRAAVVETSRVTGRHSALLACGVAVAVSLLEIVALIGWVFDHTLIKSGLPLWPNQAPLSAPTFMLAAISLWCLAAIGPTERSSRRSRNKRAASQACAALVATVGFARLNVYLFGWQSRFEMLGFLDIRPVEKRATHMALVTALAFFLVGSALFVAGRAKNLRGFQLLAIASGLSGCLGLARYVYGGEPLAFYDEMSMLSAACFTVLSVGVLCARPDAGLMALLLSDTLGGVMTRRLLPAAVFMPFFVGWLRLEAQRAGWFGTEAGLALFALSNVLLFTTLIWATARVLHGSELKRRFAVQQLADSHRESNELRTALDEHAIVAQMDARGTLTFVSDKFCVASKYTRDELVGQPFQNIESVHHSVEFMEELWRTIVKCKVWHGELKNQAKDGSTYWMDTTILPFLGRNGGTPQYIAINADITERKFVEEQLRASFEELQRWQEAQRVSETKLSMVLENMSEGVMLIDADGNAFYQNPASLRIHGFEPGQTGGIENQDLSIRWRGWDEHGRVLDVHDWPISRVTRGEHVRNQKLLARRADTNHEFFASYSGCPIYEANGKVALSFITIHDITERVRAEAAMQESEERFRTMANSIPQLAWVARSDGFIVWYNQRWYDYTGTLPEQMEGWGWQSVHDPRFLPQVMSAWPAAIAAGEAFDMEFPLRSADGQFRRFLNRAVPIKDAAGRVTQWFGTNTDVETLKQAEQALRRSEEHFRFLNDLGEATRALAEPAQIMEVSARMLGVQLRASRCAYADVDSDGEQFYILHDYTDGCESTIGRYRLSLFGARAVTTLHQGETLIIRDVAEELMADSGADMFRAIGIQAIITCPLVKEGRLRAMMAVHQATPRDWLPSEVSLVQDVVERCWATIERRAAEEKIHELNAGLEQRVVERTAQLEGANNELESFSYSVSHDLRAPLRGIHSFVRMIQEDCGDRLGAEGNRMLDVVSGEAKRMGQLIDDLLAFSRLGRHRLEKTRVDMGALARAAFENAVSTASPPIAAPQFDLGVLPEAAGDIALLRQVFANLIGNAIKYSGTRAAPVLEVGGWRNDSESTYYVKDNGVGFDEKFSHKLFGVFQRLHSEQEFEGTGVGLAIVKRVINRHGGNVRAQAKLNEGATFYFTLPT